MLGHQISIDAFECDKNILNDRAKIEEILHALVARINAVVVQIVTHCFEPHGISCVAQISASHVAIHTWPEHRFASIDLFSCTAKLDTQQIIETTKAMFSAKRVDFLEMNRGTGLHSLYFQEQ